MNGLRCVLVMVSLVWALPLRAQEDNGRAHYQAGVAAYDRGDYENAYGEFRAAYSISKRAELLYDMARALEQLKRPHEAAHALQSYLRVHPDDPDRAQVEERIRALEEEQRLVDAERKPAQPAVPTARRRERRWCPSSRRRRGEPIRGAAWSSGSPSARSSWSASASVSVWASGCLRGRAIRLRCLARTRRRREARAGGVRRLRGMSRHAHRDGGERGGGR